MLHSSSFRIDMVRLEKQGTETHWTTTSRAVNPPPWAIIRREYACCKRFSSSLSIWSMAFMTRVAFAPSSSLSIRPCAFGTICHDRPNLSFSQPHRLGAPPSAVSFAHSASISCWVSHPTKNEMASVNLNCGPALSAMNRWPSSSNSTDMTFPCARSTEMTFESKRKSIRPSSVDGRPV
jgi:hypothetical protein